MPDTTEEKTPPAEQQVPAKPTLAERVAQCEEALLELMEQQPVETELGEVVTAEAAPPRPTIGRIVHYHTAVKTYPAIVTAAHPVEEQLVDLVIFGSPLGSVGSRLNVRPGGPLQNNTWSWPPLPVPAEPVESEDDESGEGDEA